MLAAVLLAAALPACAQDAAPPVVTVDGGAVRGVAVSGALV